MLGRTEHDGSDEGPGRSKKIVRGIGSLTIQNVLNALLSFVMLAALLRYLPSLSYGAYSSVQVSIGIVGVLSPFGLNAGVVRFLAPNRTTQSSEGWGAVKAAFLSTVGISAVVSLALVASAPFLSIYFMKGPEWTWVFYLGALWLFTNSIATLLQGVLQGMRAYSLLAKILFFARATATAVALVGLLVYQSLAIAIGSWVVYGSFICLAAFPFVWRPLAHGVSRNSYLPILRYSAPLGLAGLVNAVAASADIVVVGGYLDPVSLGVYNATILISSILAVAFVLPLGTALFAETSFSARRPERVSKGTGLAVRFGILTILPASMFVVAVAAQIVILFSGGGAYDQGIPFLQLITGFYIFLALQTIAINVLQGVSRTREVLAIGLVTSVGEILMSVVLVPELGLLGAALSRVTVMIVGCVMSLSYIRPFLAGAFNYVFLSKAIVSSFIPASIVYLLLSMLAKGVWTLVALAPLGVLLFLVCTRYLRLISPEDKSLMIHLLPAKLIWIVSLF